MFMKKEKKINEIMDNFDFEKVNDVMTKINWTWSNKGVPSIEQLKELALDMLNTAYDGVLKDETTKPHESYHAACGGFEATAMKGNKGKVKYLSLHFYVTQWSHSEWK